jgi:hypothetical protein
MQNVWQKIPEMCFVFGFCCQQHPKQKNRKGKVFGKIYELKYFQLHKKKIIPAFYSKKRVRDNTNYYIYCLLLNFQP